MTGICGRLARALRVGGVCAIVLPGPAHAQDSGTGGTVSEVWLPGGVQRARAVIDDPAAADRSQFLLEFIRRTYHTAPVVKHDRREVALQALLAHLDSVRQTLASPGRQEMLPLPLPVQTWIDVVFGGRATPQTLVSAILRSRNASLLYYGLLSLDDATRAWLAAQPALITDIMSRHSSAFVLAAPGLRVSEGEVRAPGGESALPVWEAIVGRRANQPAEFVRTLLAQDGGRLAAFFGAIAQLPPPHLRLALNLSLPDRAGRIASTRRLQAVFESVGQAWNVEERTFWRPVVDPALFIAELRVDAEGRLALPGTPQFWSAVFGDDDQGRAGPGRQQTAQALAVGEPIDLPWLCEQVFRGGQTEHRRRYQLVLFASRTIRELSAETAEDAVEAIRAAGTYPALIAALERSKLADVRAFASAARRAARLSAIADEARASRALMQFQGSLALVTRAAVRGALDGTAVSRAVTSLAAIDASDRGDYEGRLVRWLADWLGADGNEPSNGPAIDENVAGPVEHAVLRLLAGRPPAQPRFVDWEGTRYRLDLARAEAIRLARMLGDNPRPFLSSARTVIGIADSLSGPGLTRERVRRDADVLEEIARAVGWDENDVWTATDAPRRYRDAAAALQRLSRAGDITDAPRLAAAFRLLADDLQARGLLEFTYAVALGQPDRALVSAGEAAGRHDFGLRPGVGRSSDPWWLPVAGGDSVRGWRVTGSLLGLDVRLAEFSLVRVSAKPPRRRPTLNDEDRRVLIETVALVEPALLTDDDRDAIASAIGRGRARLAAARTSADAAVLADEIRLGPARRTLLSWVVANDRDRLAVFLSPSELLWLGLERKPLAPTLHAWGASGEARLGCLCVAMLDRRASETLAGHWNSGVFATGFADLNLRLAELLAELRMPASLLGSVLTSATSDFIDNAASRDHDDRRGPVEFVHALRIDRVEQYLALLTTDGPLVPISDGQNSWLDSRGALLARDRR